MLKYGFAPLPVDVAVDFGTVVTLSDAGSEMNNSAVISYQQAKYVISSPLVYPKFSIADPTITFTLPKTQVANGVVDAFVHVTEQYLTYPVDAKVQDRMAEDILQTLIEIGEIAEPKNYDVRANHVWSATMALNGLIGVGVPLIHYLISTQYYNEYVISNGGSIDSLGIDENSCPVIFEYKRASNENVINQGLFYLDWLLDHKADFELLVMKTLGKEFSDKVDWIMPRLICIAGDFTKYDEYAVKQINRNIDLIRYKKFGNELLLFDLINSNVATPIKDTTIEKVVKQSADKTFDEQLESTSDNLRELYYSIRDYILALDDDVTENKLKLYSAFKKIKNIVCIEVGVKSIMLYLRLNPDEAILENGL